MNAIHSHNGDSSSTITVALIDDHMLFRSGLRDVLEADGIRVLHEASTAEAAIDYISARRPDVVIVDLGLPRMSGEEAIRRIKSLAPATAVMVLTVSAGEREIKAAVLSGACGYVLKDAPPGDIVTAVRTCATGESHLSPRVATTVLGQLRDTPAAPRAVRHGPPLSARETQVLRLVVEGNDNGAIARELVISPYTVKKHVSNILSKLRVESRLEAAVCAVRDSLV